MTIAFTLDTEVVNIAVGIDVTFKIQEFTVSSSTPSWVKKSLMRRVWANSEDKFTDNSSAKNAYYSGGSDTPYEYVPTVWAFDDDDPARAKAYLYQPHGSNSSGTLIRITNLDWSVGIDSTYGTGATVLSGRDRNNLLPYVRNNYADGSAVWNQFSVTLGYNGPKGWLIEIGGSTELDNWYYPTPTHLKFSGTGVTAQCFPMSSTAPTHPRAYRQPYLRDVSMQQYPHRMAIGGYAANDGLRLIQPSVTATVTFGGGPPVTNYGAGLWIRPGVPILPLRPWNYADTGDGGIPAAGMSHAAYGLPPVEICGAYSLLSGSPAPSVSLFLTQLKEDQSSVTDTQIATIPMVFDHASGGSDFYILQPTDSGHAATLDDDTVLWSVRTGINSTPGGSATYHWHKIPCHVQPFAMSNVTDGVSAYLPGWLYDPYA